MLNLDMTVKEFFAVDGPLSKVFPTYSPRQSQIDMAQHVFDAVKSGVPLAIEAPTGVGKSFAYLVGGLLAGAKIVVTTANKALQRQLVEKDLPVIAQIAEMYSRPFTYHLVMGKNNYACRLRSMEKEFEVPVSADLIEWIQATDSGGIPVNSGIQNDYPYQLERGEWEQVNIDECMGYQCPQASRCAFLLRKAKYAKADVLVGNQHLLALDLIMPNASILIPNGFGKDPETGAVVPVLNMVDEAHEWVGILSDMSSTQLHFNQFARYDDTIRDAAVEWFKDVVDYYAPTGKIEKGQSPEVTVHDTKVWDSAGLVVVELRRYANEVWPDSQVPTEPGEFKLSRIAKAARNLADKVGIFNSETADGSVRVIKQFDKLKEGRYLYQQLELKTIQYDVASLSRTMLGTANSKGTDWYNPNYGKSIRFEGTVPVFTSATLQAGGNFNLFLDEAGIYKSADTYRMPHAFNYREQGRLFIPRHLPTAVHSEEFQTEAADLIWDLAQFSEGRMFVLVTSYWKLGKIADRLDQLAWPHYEILRQDQGGPKILNRFLEMQGHKQILVGTSSFWQGVDVPGDALSQVVITGLPFPVPSDPVFAARCRKVDQAANREGASFMKLSLPEMSRTLQQGIGRLIRRTTDRGVVTLLDDRLVSKNWGGVVLKDLPPMTVVQSQMEISRFFDYEPAFEELV